jgi:hypothetical protein
MTAIVATTTIMGLASGCYRHSYRDGDVLPQAQPALDRTHHRAVYGWVDLSGAVEADAVCGERRVAEIRNRQSGKDWFLQVLSFGLYSPTSERIVCGSHPAPKPEAQVSK